MNLLRVNQICKKLSISRPTFYRIKKSDKSFPKPIALTVGVNVFNELEIDNWVNEKSKKQRENEIYN